MFIVLRNNLFFYELISKTPLQNSVILTGGGIPRGDLYRILGQSN